MARWDACEGLHDPAVACFLCHQGDGYLARRGLRLTERGESLMTLGMAVALLVVGYLLILLWAAGGSS